MKIVVREGDTFTFDFINLIYTHESNYDNEIVTLSYPHQTLEEILSVYALINLNWN